MKFASWNVNSLKVRLPHLLEWLARQTPQIVCLQEIKLEDAQFPVEELRAVGYHCAWSGQRTYNGVAILSREIPADVAAGMPAFPDEQKRVIAATVGKGVDAIRVVCAYVPNGQAIDSEKYEYKLKWLSAFRARPREKEKKAKWAGVFPRWARRKKKTKPPARGAGQLQHRPRR